MSKTTVELYAKKDSAIKTTTYSIEGPQKNSNELGDNMYGFCKNIIGKLIYYLFTIIDEENASLEKKSLFNSLKENSVLITYFGPIYIDFDDHPPYSDALSRIFETNINAHIWCDHGYSYSTIKDKVLKLINKKSWEVIKECFPEANQVKKFPITTVRKICKYFQ